MKKLIDIVKNYFAKTNQNNKNESKISKDDTFIDIIISLDKTYNISIQLFFDDQLKNKNLSETEYALVASEFFHIINHGKLENQITEILSEQIKKPHNENLVNKILRLYFLMNHADSAVAKKESSAIIKPSQVFSRYKNG